MQNDASFLFAGMHFDKKKFAKDFAKFQEKKEKANSGDDSDLIEDDVAEEPASVAGTKRKRKKKTNKKKKRKTAADAVDGFNVFKGSKSVPEITDEDKVEIEDEPLKERSMQTDVEHDAKILRKKYNIHTSGSNIPSPLESFSELKTRYKCRSYLLRNIAELGFEEPTPIQRQAIPLLLSGRECFACAPTGSGKTLGFVCPMLVKLEKPSRDGIRAVIISPTKELAAQTNRECKKFARGSNFRFKLMTKALMSLPDLSKLRCDILISTPLRLRMAIKKLKMDLSRVEYLVLDESDKLFELGLVKEIDAIVKACSNPSITRSLFSATLPDFVEELARTIMHDAVRVIVGRKNTASRLVKQKLVFAGSEEGKLLALRQSFAESLNPPVLIFVQNKERAKELYGELAFDDIRADVIHSDLTQIQREKAIDDFRAGNTWVLIATDVIARGMDFKGVNCVINYDFPDSASAYIHRIGRSGRAGRKGEAITLYTEDDIPYLRNIANAMTGSGCEVPEWIKTLSKKKWRRHRPRRDSITTKPKDDKDFGA